mmetsp:Transcript_51539/g.110124  ORF Transcript_51539/g.110124 Transcript_51539/m.110124 type:complete len:215 (-) Transcript_51539:174-818(-)
MLSIGLALACGAAAFSPAVSSGGNTFTSGARCTPVLMTLDLAQTTSRRAAVLGGAVSLLALPAASLAAANLNENAKSASTAVVSDVDYLQGNEDAMTAIARRTAEKNEKARLAAIGTIKTKEELIADQEAAKLQIGAAAVGGTLISSLFFYENLRRLYIKFSSGGRDSGYGTASDNDFRRNKAGGKKAPFKKGGKKVQEVEVEKKPFLKSLLGL